MSACQFRKAPDGCSQLMHSARQCHSCYRYLNNILTKRWRVNKGQTQRKGGNLEISKPIKAAVCEDYIGGNLSISECALKHDLSNSTISKIISQYLGTNETPIYMHLDFALTDEELVKLN